MEFHSGSSSHLALFSLSSLHQIDRDRVLIILKKKNNTFATLNILYTMCFPSGRERVFAFNHLAFPVAQFSRTVFLPAPRCLPRSFSGSTALDRIILRVPRDINDRRPHTHTHTRPSLLCSRSFSCVNAFPRQYGDASHVADFEAGRYVHVPTRACRWMRAQSLVHHVSASGNETSICCAIIERAPPSLSFSLDLIRKY